VRRSRRLSDDPRRGLALGGALVATGILAATLSLRAEPDLTGSGEAAVPTLVPATTVAPSDPGPDGSVPSTDVTGTTAPDATADSTVFSPTASLRELEAAQATALAEAVGIDDAPSNLDPSLKQVRKDLPAIYDDGCLLNTGRTTARECAYGDPASDITVVLVGDSHAAQWFPAAEAMATRRGWRLVVLAKRGCPFADFTTYGEGGQVRSECKPWRQKVLDRLGEEDPDLVIVTSYRYRLSSTDPRSSDGDTWRAALGATLEQLRPLSRAVLSLSDTPNPKGDVPSCVSANLSDVTDCIRDRADADRAPLLKAEREAAAANGAEFVAVSDWLCSDESCPVILGNLLLYRDDNHITATASRYLSPLLEAAASRLIG